VLLLLRITYSICGANKQRANERFSYRKNEEEEKKRQKTSKIFEFLSHTQSWHPIRKGVFFCFCFFCGFTTKNPPNPKKNF